MSAAERIELLREVLGFYGRALGWDHVAASPARSDGLLFSMRWASDEIGRLNTREYRLNEPVHPDTLQREAFLELNREAYSRLRADAQAASVLDGKPQEAT